jgi:hypothetical protein
MSRWARRKGDQFFSTLRLKGLAWMCLSRKVALSTSTCPSTVRACRQKGVEKNPECKGQHSLLLGLHQSW